MTSVKKRKPVNVKEILHNPVKPSAIIKKRPPKEKLVDWAGYLFFVFPIATIIAEYLNTYSMSLSQDKWQYTEFMHLLASLLFCITNVLSSLISWIRLKKWGSIGPKLFYGALILFCLSCICFICSFYNYVGIIKDDISNHLPFFLEISLLIYFLVFYFVSNVWLFIAKYQRGYRLIWLKLILLLLGVTICWYILVVLFFIEPYVYTPGDYATFGDTLYDG